MKLRIQPSRLRGSIAIPGSKSHTIRAVALASLAAGQSEILDPLDSADTRAAVECYRRLGARIETDNPGRWLIQGMEGRPACPDTVIDVANSGTTLRFAIGSAALLAEGAAVFTGDAQIRSRPAGPLLDSLNELGARCFSTRGNGKSPIVVQGRLTGGRTSIAAVTSQYLSCLLIHAPLAEHETIIEVTQLNEKPYVEMTLRYLDEQGIQYEREGYDRFRFAGGQGYRAFSKRIPADFSSATFFFCAGAILEADIVLEGLDFSDAQGDKAVVEILRQMGADIRIDGRQVRVKPGELRGMDIDMNAIPDALPALAVVACFARGRTRLHNVPQARLKETDRIAVMAAELAKLGARVSEQPDGLTIEPASLHAGDLQGHGDHRIVMALALAGMAVPGTTTIDTAEAVSVTFPEYPRLMQQLGAEMELTADE
ncbi:MAG: 3-phosphoshikimate 1-carboxyvinyltransferase [Sedimentisphaerales bacterium]|nr:3-phosphoshikimate 1-carboxyvinyltransferase [Sedimentisphaerales bacterium]